ncbi:DUF3618 domain-containing protein [Sphingomonas sp. NBWT7]|uniref:DUF3618 domain-containing protein n=1 Tax=Sphingomonas sp. NBWT7 TaxID=2596913 RepID=UPI00162AB491|nr:DUF3618 domain-containing protein [Sphingomonas sp. NBWT7]QNE30929.1 DUF3618 domain-containing protein [Sphingomonas sp. NBWT7]
MSDPTGIHTAEARVAEARRRFGDTVGALQAKLDPRVVARDAMDGLTEGGEKALRSGVETARQHPDAVVWSVTLAAALLARRRIAALFKRRGRGAAQRNSETAPSLARSIPGDWPELAERNDI